MSKDGDLWYVYMARCNDGTLYTGIARELKKRLAAHNFDRDGARYTKVQKAGDPGLCAAGRVAIGYSLPGIPDKKTYARRKGRTGCNKEDPEWHRLARLTA